MITSAMILVMVSVLLGLWIWGLLRHDRCRAQVEQTVAAYCADAAWRGRIGLTVRPRRMLTGTAVCLTVMASTEYELAELLVVLMRRLPRGVRITLEGTVGDRPLQAIQLKAHAWS